MNRIFKYGDENLTLNVPEGKLIFPDNNINFENLIWCDRIELESRPNHIIMVCYRGDIGTNTITFYNDTKHLSFDFEKYHLRMRIETKQA